MSSADADLDTAISVRRLGPLVQIPVVVAPPVVRVRSAILEAVREQAHASQHSEVGGLLFGHVHLGVETLCVEVTGHIPADGADSGPAHLTFTHDAWKRLRHRRLREYSHTLIVGWYHTHPGLGVFFSGMDRILHERIFGTWAWSIALVLDPVDDTRAFFWLGDGGIFRCVEVEGGPV